MEAIEIIKYLRERDFSIKADGDSIELSPPEKITDDLIQRLRKHKPAILAELKRESRKHKVLSILKDNPSLQRAIITDVESDPDNVILSMAIRNVATVEMIIPREKYDAFLLLELIEKAQIH